MLPLSIIPVLFHNNITFYICKQKEKWWITWHILCHLPVTPKRKLQNDIYIYIYMCVCVCVCVCVCILKNLTDSLLSFPIWLIFSLYWIYCSWLQEWFIVCMMSTTKLSCLNLSQHTWHQYVNKARSWRVETSYSSTITLQSKLNHTYNIRCNCVIHLSVHMSHTRLFSALLYFLIAEWSWLIFTNLESKP